MITTDVADDDDKISCPCKNSFGKSSLSGNMLRVIKKDRYVSTNKKNSICRAGSIEWHESRLCSPQY